MEMSTTRNPIIFGIFGENKMFLIFFLFLSLLTILFENRRKLTFSSLFLSLFSSSFKRNGRKTVRNATLNTLTSKVTCGEKVVQKEVVPLSTIKINVRKKFDLRALKF